MIRKLLVANRGEIAVRIIRACRELGIESVAVYSEADKDSLHAQLADQAVCIGPGPSTESYLNMESIISATMTTGADAIHPGFGFLSENARFAQICEKCGIIFVGPPSSVIRSLGNKQEARNTMEAAGVPVIPGTKGAVLDIDAGKKEADRIGYPVIIKAALGGGGKGMRTAFSPEEFEKAFLTAKKEAQMAFGDGTMYIEHFVEKPRHIEFQILADQQGNVIHLGERDCSIQRNHQKMIEESPSAAVSDKLRRKMGKAAVKAAKAAHYVNAGTIEFLLEKDENFYFMEMNTRIQVEHPVTEWVTGMDLVKEQIRIASGTISDLHFPGGQGIRVDTGIYPGYTVPPYYDSMLAKLIVHGRTREEAIAKMKSALGEVVIQGVDTNIDYQFEILSHPDFQSGNFNVGFLSTHEIGGVKVNEI